MANSQSLSTLEILVNLDAIEALDRYLSIPVEFDDSLCKALAPAALPTHWAGDPIPAAVQDIGSTWVADRESAVLAVPSAVARREHNFLPNPEHPDFVQLRIGDPAALKLAPRLVRGIRVPY